MKLAKKKPQALKLVAFFVALKFLKHDSLFKYIAYNINFLKKCGK